MRGLHIVVGGQHGSEGKGAVAGQIAAQMDRPLVIRTGGPNAGHTVVGKDGQVHKLRQLPTAVVSNPTATLGISAGSLIDPDVLVQEMLDHCLDQTPERLAIDPSATIIEDDHKRTEAIDSTLVGWSTQKGIGAARSARVRRTAKTAGQLYGTSSGSPFTLVSVANLARNNLANGDPVLIEAAQGYGLGLHTKFYPKTTSADCTAIDALADVGLSPWGMYPTVWVVLRPYPIRVAGASGPLLGETTWAELGLPQERTTVTNKVRRVGHWDPSLAAEAIWANGGPARNIVVALTMADQVVPAVRGMQTAADLRTLTEHDWLKLKGWVRRVEALGARVLALGTGPSTMVFFDDPWGDRSPIDAAIHRGGE